MKEMKEEMNNNGEQRIQLSVLDIERKYTFSPEEYTYGSDSMVAWGNDNNLPLLYLNCYDNSATLQSIINGCINYILGDEIVVSPEAGYWAKTVNRNGMTLRDFIRKISFNLLVYGGFAYQIIYNKIGYPVEFFPLDFGKCRRNEAGNKVYYSKKWTKYQTKSEEYDAFNPDKVDPKKPTQIYYYNGDVTNRVYPLPPYCGAINDVLTEIECGKYSLNTVARGFSAKYVFNFPDVGNLTNEQKKGMETAIKNKFCGSDTDSNFMLYWKNGDGMGIDIQKIESDDTPDRYIAIKDNARQNIFISMRATPVLFGLPNASNGFSTSEFSDSFLLFNKTVINPIQDIIVKAISETTGVENALSIAPFKITFESKEQ